MTETHVDSGNGTDAAAILTPTRVVAVATDGSEAATRALHWAATLARMHGARLHAVQVLVAPTPEEMEDADTRLRACVVDLHDEVSHAVVAGDDVATLIVTEAERADADILVVGNAGMRDRTEFLLGNVANRVTHLARCTVTVVNTAGPVPVAAPTAARPDDERIRTIVATLGPTVVRGLAARVLRRSPDPDAPRRLREAFETLGPTFGKLGQILSTRPDIVAPEYIAELRKLQTSVPPMDEAEVVAVMERELGVPWEDVFASIDPVPLAAGTIGQVHCATLADGHRVVVKVQRPDAADLVERDLRLLEQVTAPLGRSRRLRRVIDVPSVVEQLAETLRGELDFAREAANITRMSEILASYPRLAVPACHAELSTRRLLVMDEVQGVPVAAAPAGIERDEAARELLHSFYRQVLEEGEFHADPHPGNLMWADGRIWLLDLGMVGRLEPELRQQLLLLLLAFAQGDATTITDLTIDLGGEVPGDFDRDALEADLGSLAEQLRGRGLREIRFSELLRDLTELSVRHGIPLPARLVMVGKAIGQVQLTVAELAPEIDPFVEATRFFGRSLARRFVAGADPTHLLYEAERLRYRIGRAAQRIEHGTRVSIPELEQVVTRTARRVSLGLVAGLGWVAATAPRTTRNAGWRRASQALATVATAALAADLTRRGG